MKKFTLTVVGLFLVALAVQAQTAFYTSNFSGGLGTWTATDNTSNAAGNWLYSSSATVNAPSAGNVTFGSATAANGFAYFMSDAAADDNKPENADLTSAAISCVGHNNVVLEFDELFAQYANSVGTVSVSTDNSTWTPVYTVNATTDNPHTVQVDISGIAAGQATVYLRFNYVGNWDFFWFVDDVKLVELPAYDVALNTVNGTRYVGVTNYTVAGTLTNKGANTLTSVTLSYTANGGAPVTQVLQGLSVPVLGTYNFSMNVPIAMTTPGAYSIVVTASQPNNNTDANPGDNSITKDVTSLSQVPDKNSLVEEFTTAVCQYCPRGTTTMNTILSNHTDIFGASLHAGFGTDAMTTADHSTVAAAFTNAAPTGCVDRVLFPGESQVAVDDGAWEGYAVDRLSFITPVGVSASNDYNSNTREITVNVTAKFYGPVSGDYRVNAYIIEDSVTGTGSGYNQVNAYNTQSGSPWYQAGNPIIGFQHRHVCREMLGGAWGTTGVIPATTTDGGTYTKQYTFTLPSGWNDQRIEVIALVQHYDASVSDREILNVIEMGLNEADSTGTVSSIVNPASALSFVKLFPNPANDVVNINYSVSENTTISFDVYDVAGHLVQSIQPANFSTGSYTETINTSSFDSGLYFVTIKDGNKAMNTLRFVVSK